MNNTVGERAEKSLEFKEMLEKRTGLPVVMWDERLTTMAADRTLEETGVHKEDRKQYLDQVAAVFILQDIWMLPHTEESSRKAWKNDRKRK